MQESNRRLLSELRRAEDLRGRTANGIREYTMRSRRELSLLRKQRAWAVMLGLRKAYTLLRRRGLKGQAGFWSWVFKLPFAGLGSVADCDVRLPLLSNYVPADFAEPFRVDDPEEAPSGVSRGITGQAKACLASIIIVTHNSAEFVGPCLESLRRNTAWPDYEVRIVDNASTDGTVESVRRYALDGPRIHLTCLDSNRGFAAANNLAVKNASGEYLALLNADIVVTSGWLERLIRRAGGHASIGIVSPVTNYAGNEIKINGDYSDARELEQFAARIAREKNGRSFEIAVAPLFCTLIPRYVWDRAGELDESFEIGMFEDDDFSYRVRRLGYRIVAAEDCFIHHFGQGSFSQIPPDSYRRLFENNRRRFEEKWRIKWQPHHTRPNVRPPGEEPRFSPREFWR